MSGSQDGVPNLQSELPKPSIKQIEQKLAQLLSTKTFSQLRSGKRDFCASQFWETTVLEYCTAVKSLLLYDFYTIFRLSCSLMF